MTTITRTANRILDYLERNERRISHRLAQGISSMSVGYFGYRVAEIQPTLLEQFACTLAAAAIAVGFVWLLEPPQ